MFALNKRPRRLRQNPTLRSMLKETHVLASQLIQPLFIKEGIDQPSPIQTMPGIHQWTLATIAAEAKAIRQAGISAVILFGIPQIKDSKASQAYHPQGVVQRAIAQIKNACPDLLVITDVCLCEYMEHGHCGIVSARKEIDNDASVELLARTALSHVVAGADMVAPSDMMDGRVGVIRKTLDASGYSHVPIMSYAVKYASNFYGPFREAAESAPQFGDRKSYQMDYANLEDAFREALLDEQEGADILMIKPAMPYLDIISRLKQKTHLPIAAYQVSGEYSMLLAASEKGWLDLNSVITESLTAIKRAGAQLIVTYFAKQAAEVLD